MTKISPCSISDLKPGTESDYTTEINEYVQNQLLKDESQSDSRGIDKVLDDQPKSGNNVIKQKIVERIYLLLMVHDIYCKITDLITE